MVHCARNGTVLMNSVKRAASDGGKMSDLELQTMDQTADVQLVSVNDLSSTICFRDLDELNKSFEATDCPEHTTSVCLSL
jgi:hypothetical protein